jgi:hypothetical protein
MTCNDRVPLHRRSGDDLLALCTVKSGGRVSTRLMGKFEGGLASHLQSGVRKASNSATAARLRLRAMMTCTLRDRVGDRATVVLHERRSKQR